jgi:Tol biopolymer transport system component
MTDLEQRFRTLDRLDAPDLWPQAKRRSPGTRPGPRQRHRLAAAVLAFTVAAAGVGFAIWAFEGGSQPPEPRPAAAVENGQIAFVRRAETGSTITLVDPDGSNLSYLVGGSDPAWSPDGRTLAFVRAPSGEKPDIFTVSADGSHVTQLLTLQGQPGGIGPQALSPDGTQLVFASVNGIFVMNADGTGVRRVTRNEWDHACYDLHPSWSPDGATMVFAVMCEGGNEGLWTVAVDGSDLRQLVGGDYEVDEYRSPVWSPDGTKVAFVKTEWTRDDPINQASIQVVNADGTGLTSLVSGVAFDRSLAWSPDGRALAFTRYREGGSDIFLLTLHTGKVTELTNTGDALDPAWQPIPLDGQTTSPAVSPTRCVQATTSGDFDGDGTVDEAKIVAVVPADVSCKRNGDVYTQMESQQVEVRFGSEQALDQTLTGCQPCLTGSLVFAGTDLDGDGRDELAIDVGPGAATDYVEFYRVDASGISPLVVFEPGDPPYVEPGPAILGGGFDSGLWSPIECRVTVDGTHELISVHAENLTGPITGPWKVHTTTMVLEGDRLVVTSTDDVKSESYARVSDEFQNGCS